MTGPLLLALASLAGTPGAAAEAPSPRPTAAAARPVGARRTQGPAAGVGPGGPAVIDAEHFQWAFQKHEIVFTGNPVKLRRDDATLTCRRLVARNDEAGQVEHAVCTGDVRFTRGQRLVTCEKATYEAAAARIICEGSPVLRDGANEARGTRLVYELRSDEAHLEHATVTLPGEQVEARRRDAAKRQGEARR
jgi:lipopolysaccharide export system protein LptA